MSQPQPLTEPPARLAYESPRLELQPTWPVTTGVSLPINGTWEPQDLEAL